MTVNTKPLFSKSINDPIVITPESDRSLTALLDYTATHEQELAENLRRFGGILFRGFDVRDAAQFHQAAEGLKGAPFGYVGGDSPRKKVVENIFTSTEYPADEVITLHNEMSYLPEWPQRLFFFSLVPAQSGGQTSLSNSRSLHKFIPKSLIEKFRSKKIRYIRNFHSNIPFGKSWQDTYQTSDRTVVEAVTAQQNSSCEWRDDETLRVSTICAALTVHPETNEELWFNQADQWHASALNSVMREMFEEMVGKGNLPHECQFGDGEPMPEEDLAQIRAGLNENKLLFDWERGDVLMIDNILMMHGRESFRGDRKTLAYLSSV